MNTRQKRKAVHAVSKRTGMWLCGTRLPLPLPANGNVTCRVCLYHLGLYVPLSKLREHQDAQSGGRVKYGRRES